MACAFHTSLHRARAGEEEFYEPPPRTSVELESLLGPIALYPDSLQAVMLAASTVAVDLAEQPPSSTGLVASSPQWAAAAPRASWWDYLASPPRTGRSPDSAMGFGVSRIHRRWEKPDDHHRFPLLAGGGSSGSSGHSATSTQNSSAKLQRGRLGGGWRRWQKEASPPGCRGTLGPQPVQTVARTHLGRTSERRPARSRTAPRRGDSKGRVAWRCVWVYHRKG